MSTPTRQEILDAYEALETLTNTCIHGGDLAEELQELVLRALPPKPELPTMEGVEWDNELHYLAEAMVGGTKLIMLSPDLGGWIRTFNPKTGKVMPVLEPRDVTPTGKRYTLTEVQE